MLLCETKEVGGVSVKKVTVILFCVALIVCARLIFLSQQATQPASAPVITVIDILNASDLTEGVKQAVDANNQAAIDEWLDKALHVAQQAQLSEQDIEWLSSKQAKDYVVFNAKRDLFHDEFERRYINLQGIDDLKHTYPEASNMFDKAQTILEKRDDIIRSIATTVAQGAELTEQHFEQARDIWRERYLDQQQAGAN